MYVYGMCYVSCVTLHCVNVCAVGAPEQQWGSQWADLQEMLIFCQGFYLHNTRFRWRACFVASCGTSFYVTLLFCLSPVA